MNTADVYCLMRPLLLWDNHLNIAKSSLNLNKPHIFFHDYSIKNIV